MRKPIKKICFVFLACLFVLAPLSAMAQNASDLRQKYYDGVFGNPKKCDIAKYAPGPEELLYYKATDWEYGALQLKYDGVKNMMMEEFVGNINPGPYNSANPAGWIVAVHYPKTGNTDVNLDITQKAARYYEADVPAPEKMAAALNTDTWPSADKIDDADSDFNTGALLFYLSYINKKLTQIQGEEYIYPKENAGLIYTAITTYQITEPSDKYMSVIFTKWFFTGGAHDMWQADVASYDMTTGKELTINDLLGGNDTAKLMAHLKAMDEAQRGKDNFVASMNGGKYPDLEMSRMALTKDGLLLIFNPYEIGSFAEGSILYQIDKKDLKALGVNTKFWE